MVSFITKNHDRAWLEKNTSGIGLNTASWKWNNLKVNIMCEKCKIVLRGFNLNVYGNSWSLVQFQLFTNLFSLKD